MRILQRYRMRVPSTGREVIVDAEPDIVYVDKQTGEHLEPVAQLTPVAPTPSDLPWSLEKPAVLPALRSVLPEGPVRLSRLRRPDGSARLSAAPYRRSAAVLRTF